MKKTRNKAFLTIFFILNIFLIGVMVLNNYQNYKMQKKAIVSIFDRMSNSNRGEIEHFDRVNDNIDKSEDEPKKIFLDSVVYTIVLDDNGKYKYIINHTENNINQQEIKEISLNIIDNHKYDYYIGNLYFNKYSYSFVNNSLILVDNTLVNKKLSNLLLESIILFVFLEILVVFFTNLIIKWIMKPVVISFEAQRQFIADASHELKTPISVIIASADAFYDNKQIKWIDNIKNESIRMNKLITSLLELANSENKDEEVYEKNNLSVLVESTILTLESLFYEKNIKLDYCIDEGIYFVCNSRKIKDLINILLDNAIKHCSLDGDVIVKLTRDKFYIVLEVINKGEPIAKGEENKIFERFYRSDKSRNRSDNRYGLGLAIAKNIVLNHNGKIIAFSKDGYTTFKIIFKNKVNIMK